jgi:hypothetical protein
MPRGIPICKELKQMVINAHLERKKQSAISKQFLLPKYSVSKIISTYNRRGHLDKIQKSGKPRKTTILMDRRIKRMSQNDPWLSAPRIIAEIPEILVSPRTIQRRLVQAKLFSRRPAKKPLVPRRNRLARLAFAREHINWTIHDWKKVLFSDETRYKMYSSDGMKHVRRPVNTRIPDSISSTLHLQLNMEGGVFSYRAVFRGME